MLAGIAPHERSDATHRFGQEEEMLFRFDAEIFEDGVRPESLHMVLDQTISTL